MSAFVHQQAVSRSTQHFVEHPMRDNVRLLLRSAHNGWLPQHQFVAFLETVVKHHRDGTTVAAQMGATFVQMHPRLYELSARLQHFNSHYQAVHRGNAGRIYVQPDDTVWRITAATPYPYAFMHGMIDSLVAHSETPDAAIASETITRTFCTFSVAIKSADVVEWR